MKNILFLGFFVYLSYSLFCVELWNGFTTDMSLQDAISRAEQILSPEKIETHDSSRSLNVTAPSYDNFGYPSPMQNVTVRSNLEDYSSGDNIELYFYQGKLFAITIRWKYDSYQDSINETVAKIAVSRYGNPNRVIRITQWGRPYNAYFWRLQGKDFYSDLNRFIIVDNSVRDIWVLEQKRILAEREASAEAKRKAEEEERLRKASEAIHF